MPKIKISLQRLHGLFEESNNETKGFKEIKPELILKNPQKLLVFRLILGKSLVEMGALLNKTYATISQYEREKIASIPLVEAEKIVKVIKRELPRDITFGSVKDNFERFYQLSSGGITQAFKSAENALLTKQERIVSELLEKNKIVFEPNKTLNTSVGKLNFDFWLPENRIVIECTSSTYKEKIESLGFRIIKLKEKTKCISIAVLNEKINKGILRRLTDYDHIIFMDKLSMLPSLIK